MAQTYTANYSLGVWDDGDNPGATELNLNWTTIDEQLNESEILIQNLDDDVQVDLNAISAYIASQRNAVFDGRMQYDSATQISLQRYAGSRVSVNGEILLLDSSGLTCLSTHNRIDASGTDAGAALGNSTLYYVYVSNGSASFAPRSLRCSTVAPTSYNGIKYLAASGNGANWRFVGWVYTNGSAQFSDNLTARLVINYYNRLDLRLVACPGYVDDDANTTYTQAGTATWVEVNGGTGSRVSFISNGADTVASRASMYAALGTPTTDYFEVGIAHDAVTDVACSGFNPFGTGGVVEAANVSVMDNYTHAEGYHSLLLVVLVGASVGPLTIYADDPRAGSTTDPKITFIECTVKG